MAHTIHILFPDNVFRNVRSNGKPKDARASLRYQTYQVGDNRFGISGMFNLRKLIIQVSQYMIRRYSQDDSRRKLQYLAPNHRLWSVVTLDV